MASIAPESALPTYRAVGYLSNRFPRVGHYSRFLPSCPLLLKEPTQDTTTESGFKVRLRVVRKAWKDNSLLEIASRVTKTALTPKRLKWMIVGEAKCDSKIRRFSQLNSFLLECLDRTDKTDLFQMTLLQMNTSKDLTQQANACLAKCHQSTAVIREWYHTGRQRSDTHRWAQKQRFRPAGWKFCYCCAGGRRKANVISKNHNIADRRDCGLIFTNTLYHGRWGKSMDRMENIQTEVRWRWHARN